MNEEEYKQEPSSDEPLSSGESEREELDIDLQDPKGELGQEPSEEQQDESFDLPSEIVSEKESDLSAATAVDESGAGGKTKKQRSGALTFAIVMSICFGLSLLLLFASILGEERGWFLSDLFDIFDEADEPDVADDPSEESDEGLTLQQISARGKKVVVAISVETTLGGGSGSGIIMTSDGYIATNFHVIDGAKKITVYLYNGNEYSAEVIGSSEIDDLAVLKIDAQGLTAATFGNSGLAREGDRVVVIGHPAGLEFGWTSTFGFVSAINRDVKIRDYDGTLTKKMTLIQTDANVNSGNSGGPMFNDRGQVIGIITMKLAGDYEGMGFAIPSNGALPLLEALIKTGTTDGVQSEVSSARPELGITGVPVEKDQYYVLGQSQIFRLTEQEAAQTEGSFCAEATGVLITAISETSDAYEKMQVGDIIVSLDGRSMTSIERMREYLYDHKVGDEIVVDYVRDGESAQATIVLRAGN